MEFKEIIPPRAFEVGRRDPVEITDCAQIKLAPNEQITLKTESGSEYDIVRKSWGYYATSSLNGRLQGFGLRGVLVKNPDDRYYIFLVERGKEDCFQYYCDIQELTVVCWLDNDKELKMLEKKLNSG